MPEQKSEHLDHGQILDLLNQITKRIYLDSDLYVQQMHSEDYDHYSKMSEIAKISDEYDRNEEIKKLAIRDGRDDLLRTYFDLLGDQINDVLDIQKNLRWLQIICEEKALETIIAVFTYSQQIDVNLGTPNTPTPFEIACGVKEPNLISKPEAMNSSLAIVKEFIATGKLDVSKCEINPLCTACAFSSIPLVLHLLKNADKINLIIDNETVAFYKDLQDPNAIKKTPLSIACVSSDRSDELIVKANKFISKKLVESGANTTVITSLTDKEKNALKTGSNQIPLFFLACINGHLDVIQKYLAIREKDITYMKNEVTAGLFYAVINNQVEVLKLLIEKGADVNVTILDENEKETKAFHQACADGNIAIVRQLLTYQELNVNSQTKKGTTALYAACQYNQNDIVKLLLDHNAVIDLPDNLGVNALLLACTRLNLEILKYYQTKRPSEFKEFINKKTKIDAYGTIFTFLIYTRLRTLDNSQFSSAFFQVMDFLLKNGANIEGKPDEEVEILDNETATPLMIACNFNSDLMINFLLKNKASVQGAFYKTCQLDSKDNQFKIDKRKVCDILIEKKASIKDAFNDALIIKNKKIVNFLLENYSLKIIKSLKANEMFVEKEEIKFLFDIACETNHLELVKILLEDSDHNTSFPKIFKEAFNDTDPLLIACQKNSTKIVDLLIKKGADVTQSFCLALQSGDLMSAELLFNQDIKVGSLFMEACKKGSEDDKTILEFLLKKVQKLTFFIRVGLHIAIEHNKEEIVILLLEHLNKDKGFKLDFRFENGMTLFCLACQKGNLIAVEKFLNCGINVNLTCKSENFYNFSPLHFACENKHFTIVKKLLKDKNLVLDCVNSSKETPLYLALKQKSEDIARELINHGASIDKVLELACKTGDLETIEYLKEKFDFAVDRPVDLNKTALHLACENGHIKIVTFLLRNKVEVNKTTNDNSTALHLACKKGHAEIAELLLLNGANKKLKNDKREKPADIAEKKDNKALKDLFGLNVKTQIDPEQERHSILVMNSLLYSNKKLTIKKVINNKEEKDKDKKEFNSPLNNVSTMKEEKDDQTNIAEISPYKIYKLLDGTYIQLPRKEVHPLTTGKKTTTEIAVDNYEIYYDNLKSSHIPEFEKVATKAKYYPSDATDKKCIHGLEDEIFAIKLIRTKGANTRVLGTIIGTAVEDGKQLIYFQKTVKHKRMNELLENRSKLKKTLQSPKELKDKLIDPKTVVFEDKRVEAKTVVFGNKS